MSRAIAAAAIGLFLLADPIAVRADNVEAFAGGQADFANYVFAGASVAWPGSSIGNGLAFRGYFDTGGYDYVRHDLGVIRANFSGEELDAVYGITLKHIWNDLGVGVNATYTGLSPYDSKNLLAGDQTELRLSLDGGTDGGPWRADWLGYYGTRLYDYNWS
ncbi:MAG: cellulose biosynthesis protein BcsS, partial [Candidatus Cybelea sp.]